MFQLFTRDHKGGDDSIHFEPHFPGDFADALAQLGCEICYFDEDIEIRFGLGIASSPGPIHLHIAQWRHGFQTLSKGLGYLPISLGQHVLVTF